ncbi:hypothetical protein Tco_1287200 [Tanacetum coccineum]
MVSRTKAVKAQDKSELVIIAGKNVTSLVSVRSPRRIRLLLEELGVIVKTVMNFKMTKAYIVLNKETIRIEESLNVTFDESLLEPKSSPSVENDRINDTIVQDLNGSLSLHVNVSDEGYPKSVKEARGHPIEQVIGILLTNVFSKIEAQESLPISVGYMLYCIKTKTPFNFAYFIARRLSGLDYNNEALPYARVMITLFEYLKNKYPNDAS